MEHSQVRGLERTHDRVQDTPIVEQDEIILLPIMRVYQLVEVINLLSLRFKERGLRWVRLQGVASCK